MTAYLNATLAPLATLAPAHGASTSAVPAICSFPLSGQYGPGVRFLYYVLVVICVFGSHLEWVLGASLAAALLFPAVAAIHAIIIASISGKNGAVDLDMFGTLQFCATGILCVPLTVRYSDTYFKSKGRNIVFIWTALNIAGLISLVVAFYRADAVPCAANGTNVTWTNFWTLQSNNSQTVCFSPEFTPSKGGCHIMTSIRQDASNPSQWVPAPQTGMTIRTATLLSAACCIPAIVSLFPVWERIMRVKWLKLFHGHRVRATSRSSAAGGGEGAIRSLPEQVRGVTRDRSGTIETDLESGMGSDTGDEKERKLKAQHLKRDRSVENRIKLALGLIERIVFTACTIAIVVIGERNFWTREMRSGVEPMSSIGQWGPIVGAALAVLGSLFTYLFDSSDDNADKNSIFSDLPPTPDPNAQQNGTSTIPPTSRHRKAVNAGIFRLLRLLNTPGANRFANEINWPKFDEWPELPGERDKDPGFANNKQVWEAKRKETMASRSSINLGIVGMGEEGWEVGPDPTTSSGAGPSVIQTRERSASLLTVPSTRFRSGPEFEAIPEGVVPLLASSGGDLPQSRSRSSSTRQRSEPSPSSSQANRENSSYPPIQPPAPTVPPRRPLHNSTLSSPPSSSTSPTASGTLRVPPRRHSTRSPPQVRQRRGLSVGVPSGGPRTEARNMQTSSGNVPIIVISDVDGQESSEIES